MGEAVMNTAAALAAIWAPPTTASAPFLTPFIIANGAAQIAAIAAAQPGSGSIVNPSFTTNVSRSSPIESASPDFFRTNQSRPQNQVVLVTEDLAAVQGRVAITEDRASIGG